MSDHYTLLGVARDAPTAAIRAAYARLARDHHPDRFTDPARKKEAEDLLEQGVKTWPSSVALQAASSVASATAAGRRFMPAW